MVESLMFIITVRSASMRVQMFFYVGTIKVFHFYRLGIYLDEESSFVKSFCSPNIACTSSCYGSKTYTSPEFKYFTLPCNAWLFLFNGHISLTWAVEFSFWVSKTDMWWLYLIFKGPSATVTNVNTYLRLLGYFNSI